MRIILSKHKSVMRVLAQIFFIIFSITIIFTLYYLYINGIKTEREFAVNPFSLPRRLSFKNYAEVWTKYNINIAFKNSAIISLTSCFFITGIGIIAAYAFALLKFRLKRLFFSLVIISLFLSPLILIIPLYIVFTKLKLVNTYTGTILIYSGIRVAFVVFILNRFFKEIPEEIIDAAKIDGCSDLRLLMAIFIPLAKPAILSIFLLNFFSIWNDLVIGVIFMTSPEHYTLTAAIARFKEKEAFDITPMFASLSMMTTPVILLYIFLQKYFVRGMTLGSSK